MTNTVKITITRGSEAFEMDGPADTFDQEKMIEKLSEWPGSSFRVLDNPKPRVDWRTLSEKTGYKVLTLPDGSTLDVTEIVGVRVVEADKGLSETYPDACPTPRHVQVFGRGAFGVSTLSIVTDDADDFFAMATDAHRRASMADTERLRSVVEAERALKVGVWKGA